MGRTARERLAKLLDNAQASGAFSAQTLAPADALQVEVNGVGRCTLLCVRRSRRS